MYPSDELPKFMLRLPADLKLWIANEARRNGCSQNSEIIRCVRERMESIKASKELARKAPAGMRS